MPIIIVGEERTFSELRPRLFEGRVSRAVSRRVTDLVTEANPHADLSRLEPGVVLTIPDVPEIRMRGDLSADDMTKRAVQEVSTALTDALQRTEESLKQRTQTERSERRRIQRTLESSTVAEAKRKDRKLGADLSEVAETLAADDARAKEASAAFKKAAGSWRAGLEELQSLVD